MRRNFVLEEFSVNRLAVIPFPFSGLTLLVGRQEGHPACKKLDVGWMLVVIWLELCATYSSSCHHHLHHPLLQKTPANPGSPGKWPLKRSERDWQSSRRIRVAEHFEDDRFILSPRRWSHKIILLLNRRRVKLTLCRPPFNRNHNLP